MVSCFQTTILYSIFTFYFMLDVPANPSSLQRADYIGRIA